MKAKKFVNRILHYDRSYQLKTVTPHEIDNNGLKTWSKLPERIRRDSALAGYQAEYNRSQGESSNVAIVFDERLDDPSRKADNVQHDALSINSKTQSQSLQPTNPNEYQIDCEKNKNNFFTKYKDSLNYVKIVGLFAIWALFTGFLMATNEKEVLTVPMSIPVNQIKVFSPNDFSNKLLFQLRLSGGFANNLVSNNTRRIFTIQIQVRNRSGQKKWKSIEQWKISLLDSNSNNLLSVHEVDRIFDLRSTFSSDNVSIQIVMETNIDVDFPFQLSYDTAPVNKDIGIIYGLVILIGLYVMIIWEIVDKVFATIIASTLCISVLAIMGARPTLPTIISWIDIETLFLLFGMMIIVGIMTDTGLFDYLAVFAYKMTNGNAWPLIYCLCLFTAILSAILDNVTSLLLLAPVSIRLCEIMNLNPIPILISMILYSNIGGAWTPVGDPPNIIIISNSFVTKNGITFTNFILHMTFGVLLAGAQTFLQLRFKYRTIADLRIIETKEIIELREKIHIWQEALNEISLQSNTDTHIKSVLVDKIKNLKHSLRKQQKSGTIRSECYSTTLRELEEKYPIRNRMLLLKSIVALTFVLSFFFLHSVPGLDRLSLGWIAFLGALLLLILADKNDMDAVLKKVEWSTLIFFASLFVLIEALSELGLIDWIGKQTQAIIVSVDEIWRLPVAILIILWISAIASSFLDNIPITTMMIKIIILLAQNDSLRLPLAPLVWALSFGACFGGNGTLIGASANIITATVAEQQGYKFTFCQYFRIGFPMMIGNVLMATVYLMIAHVLLEWH